MKILRVLLVLLLGLTGVQGAEPPEQGRALTEEEQKEVAQLQFRLNRHTHAGQFEEAAEAAKQIAEYRAEKQGKTHWEVIDACLNIERCQRWARVPANDRGEVVRALLAAGEGTQLWQRLRYREAEKKMRESLEILRQALGELHPDTATSYNDVAECLADRGKHAEAEPLYHKALEIRRNVLGEQHPDTAASYNDVAACLGGRGKYAEAEPRYHKALEIRRKVLGEQHPDTAVSYNNLAQSLLEQGKHTEALPLYHRALEINRKLLGEKHPHTAKSYHNLADCLNAQGKHGEALPLFHKALEIRRKVSGEKHPETAACYNNLAACLNAQGKHAEALALLHKALDIWQKTLGEQHASTAHTYNNLAGCLHEQGKHAEALPLFHRALEIRRKVLGEQHRDTANSYNHLALCLWAQGKHAEAQPLFHRALEIKQKTLGEQHPSTTTGYYNVARCLQFQGKHAEALALFHKALNIRRQILGDEHPDTATTYNSLALCLQAQGKHGEALPLYHKSLNIRRQILGDEHPDTARSYNDLAACLNAQGKNSEALPLYHKALEICRDVLGDKHPDTGACYNNLAACLNAQGKRAEALPLSHKALEICRDVLGDDHPDTAACYNNVAQSLLEQGKHAEAVLLNHMALHVFLKVLGEQHPTTAAGYCNSGGCLYVLGKHAEAAQYFEKALLGHEFGRLQASESGFDRSLFQVDKPSPRAGLAACLVRLNEPVRAWEHAESDLGRGLLDDLLPDADAGADASNLARLSQLDQALLPLLTRETLDDQEMKQRDDLAKERDDLLAELARITAQRARARVLSLENIQKQIPADAALVFWLDAFDLHVGCILRREGQPHWVVLRESDEGDVWTDEDHFLPARTLAALADGTSDTVVRQRLLAQLYRQRIAPLERHLEGVERLIVIPAGRMASVPVEALTDRYTISYAASASVFAHQVEKHRPLDASSLLVLADPTFTRPAAAVPPAPPHGLLVKAVLPGSMAARIGLRPGDVLLEYNDNPLSRPEDLKPADGDGDERIAIKLWRDGQAMAGRIPAGKLGMAVDDRPVAQALADWRNQQHELLASVRGGKDWQALPGTRLEALTLASLVPDTTVLVGSDASEQQLDELAAAGKLRQFRLLHLATHGEANTTLARETALILAQDRLPSAEEQAKLVLAGEPVPLGRLTVGKILSSWELDADLVVLSACQTGLGQRTGGEGMLGFSQALMQKGARSVVLSRWKVDDAATALLMARFYENLLGGRAELTAGLPRAEALREAKAWLRSLARSEAEQQLATLVEGVPRGERGSIQAALPTRPADAPQEDHPFEHPYYWAAFVLLGDPG